MRTTRRVVLVLFAIVAILSQVHTTGATPVCHPYDTWVGCSPVVNDDPDWCSDGSAWDFCDGVCYEYFGVGVSSVSSCYNWENPPGYSAAVSCNCAVR